MPRGGTMRVYNDNLMDSLFRDDPVQEVRDERWTNASHRLVPGPIPNSLFPHLSHDSVSAFFFCFFFTFSNSSQ